MEALHSRRTYHYRIQEAICESGDRELFPELNIPRSTIRSWIHRGPPDVISCDLAAHDHAELIAQIEELRHRTALLGAVVALLVAVFRASKIQLDYERLPEGDAKRILLRAIKRAKKALPLSATLRITRLSASRYHGWCRAEVGCDLNDQPSCPRVVPTRLTPDEVENMRRMVESDDHRHMSLRALALHAQRIGKVLASPSTVVPAGPNGRLEATSNSCLSGQTQDRNPGNGSRRAPSLGRDDHPVARWNESISSCGDRQLFPADPVVDSPGTARQRRDLSDIARSRCSAQ